MTESTPGPQPRSMPLEFLATSGAPITAQRWVIVDLPVEGAASLDPAELRLQVDIIHRRPGGLALWLKSPDGSYYRVRTTDGEDLDAPLPASYYVDLATDEVDGLWQLWIYDAYSTGAGLLQSWRLSF